MQPGSDFKYFERFLSPPLRVKDNFTGCNRTALRNNVTGFVLNEVVYEFFGSLSKGQMRQNRIY